MPSQELLGPLDYVAIGLEGVERYVADAGSEDAQRLRAALLLAERNVVLIQHRRKLAGSTFWNSSYNEGSGTGFVVGEEGDIVTAGHVVQERSRGTEYVFYREGRKHSAFPQEFLFDEHDSSHLDIGMLSTKPRLSEVGLPSGSPIVGELVIVAGFPDNYGLSDGSTIVKVHQFSGSVKPIPLIARVKSIQPYQLELVAGSMSRGGMSGSPLINMAGECIGILSGSTFIFAKDAAPIFLMRASKFDLQALKRSDSLVLASMAHRDVRWELIQAALALPKSASDGGHTQTKE